MFQKDMRLSLLLDYYGNLLNEQRRLIMEFYYYEDLSLSEIAEHMVITRQAVRDSIKKGEAELSRMEDALRLAERFPLIARQRDVALIQAEHLRSLLKEESGGAALDDLLATIRSIYNE